MRSEAERGGRRNKMGGKIPVALVAVLVCAFFLVPCASAACKLTIIDTWVEGPSGEVLDEYTYVNVIEGCTYKLKIGIEDTSVRPVYVRAYLTFGPNYGNRNCKDYRTKEGKIDTGETTTTIAFANISFLPLADCDEGFKEFVEGQSLMKWDKYWYKFDVESTMICKGDQTEIKRVIPEESEIPVLPACVVRFYDPRVEENETYKDGSYDYHVKVRANCEDHIELQVRNYTSKGWDIRGLQSYTELDVDKNKTLSWHAVNLTHDNFDVEGRGQYKFVSNISDSKPYSGPTIEEKFKVSYNKTIDGLLAFDYEVSAWMDQVNDSIMLEVYNYSLRDWEPKGIRNYTTAGKKQTLIWERIYLSCDHFFGAPLSGKYRLVGKYNTSTNITGPAIEENFYTLAVTPNVGKNNGTFNYSVTVNANICDKIALQVKNHTTHLWDSKGTRDYTTPNINGTLTWHEIQLNTHELSPLNNSMFRFVGMCDMKSSEKGLPIWPIPITIGPFFGNHSVKPDSGLYSERVDYSIEVKAEKNGTVKLSIFCPDGCLFYEKEQYYNKAPEWQILNWSVQNLSGCDVKTGTARYLFEFRYNGDIIINQTGEGPYIGTVKFGDGTVEPEIGTDKTLFDYTINVTAAHTGSVVLLTRCSEGAQWAISGGEIAYETPNKWKMLTWTRIELPCDVAGNAEFMFGFIPGYIESEKYKGPEIIEEELGDQ